MKKLFLLLFIVLCSLISFAQFPVKTPQGAPNTLNYARGGMGADSTIVLRTAFSDTTQVNFGFLKFIPGSIIRVADALYMRNEAATAWIPVGTNSSNNSNLGSGYRILKPASQGLRTILAGGEINLDTSLFANNLIISSSPALQAVTTYGNITTNNVVIGSNLFARSQLAINAPSVYAKKWLTLGDSSYSETSTTNDNFFRVNQIDTFTTANLSTRKGLMTLMNRTVNFENGLSYGSKFYGGTVIGLTTLLPDSIVGRNQGGDFEFALNSKKVYQQNGTGRKVYTTASPIGQFAFVNTTPSFVGMLQLTGGSGANHQVLRGWHSGIQSYYLGVGSSFQDTVYGYVGVMSHGAIGTTKILKAVDFLPYFTGYQVTGQIDSALAIFQYVDVPSIMEGSWMIGRYPGITTDMFGSNYSSAKLQVNSLTKGVIFSRMPAANRIAMPSPTAGTMVFDTDSASYFQYNGSIWQNLYTVGSGGGGGGGVASVSGTPNRITSTGGTTPTIDISATFEGLLGKVASPLSQFASTTSAQLGTVLSNETGSGLVVFGTAPTITGATLTTSSVNGVTLDNTGAATQYLDKSGNYSTPAGSSGVTTMAAIGAVPNANGASISTTTLTLQPADGSFGGVVTTTTQTFAGAKTFSSAPTFSTFTAGSIPFIGASGLVSQDNANFFWDNTNKYLGIRNAVPLSPLDIINGSSNSDNSIRGITVGSSNVTYPSKGRMASNFNGFYITNNAEYNGSSWVRDVAGSGSSGITMSQFGGTDYISINVSTTAQSATQGGPEIARFTPTGVVLATSSVLIDTTTYKPMVIDASGNVRKSNYAYVGTGGGGGVSSVSGTTNRITSTGGATPVIDISATFEGLLGKVASPLSQFASTTSAQLGTVLSDETGSGVVVFGTAPTISGATITTSTVNGVTLASGGSASLFLTQAGTYVSAGGVGTVTSASVVTANGFAGSVATATSTPAITISTTVTGLLKGNGTSVSAASAGTDYEVPLTFSTGLTRSTNTITVNTSQNISTLSNLTANGFVTTSGGTGALSVTTLGTGVATFLSTPTTANFAAAVTGETGTGAVVFGTAPTITGATITTTSVNGVTLDNTGAATLYLDKTGNYSTPAGGGSGVTTMAAIGAVPNANGASISSVTLTLQPANGSFGGVVTTTTQTFAGVKTFSSIPLAFGMTSSNTDMILKQTGDTFGESGLIIQNKSGAAGATFYNVGLDLVDMQFQANSLAAYNFRYEHRSAQFKNATNTGGEFQFMSSAGTVVNQAFGNGGTWLGGKVGISVAAPTALLHIAAGTTAANTAPLKFTSGSLMTTAEAGGVEFLTDKFYGTITTSAARKEFTLNDAALTSGRVPFATTNGRLTDNANFTFATSTLSLGVAGSAGGAIVIAGSTSGTATINVAAAAGSTTFTLPVGNGTSGYYLQTNGSGVTSWQPAGSSITVSDNSLLLTSTVLTTNKVPQALTDGATITMNANLGFNGRVVLGGNRTLSITNPENGTFYSVKFVQDGTGGRTITLPGGTSGTISTTIGDSTIVTGFYGNSGWSWSSPLTASVTSITGTANQVIASASTGAVTLSLPQDIHTSATPRFAGLGIGVAQAGPQEVVTITASTSPGIGSNGYFMHVSGTLIERSSGTHTFFAGLAVDGLLVTSAAATLTDAVSFYVANASNGTVTGNNYALWIDAGLNRFDGGIMFGVVSTSSNLSVDDNTYNVEVTSGTPTITLPSTTGRTGREITVINSGASTAVISTTSSQVIGNSGSATTLNVTAGAAVTVVAVAGGQWRIKSS